MSRSKLSIILLMAAIVRMAGISVRPIWYDEAFSILFSSKGPAAMIYGTLTSTSTGAADIHPLGYYTLLWIWSNIFGESLVAVRLLSIIAGLLTVTLAYFLAQELFSEKVAVVASLFVALAPFQVHYSQEIRMYAFLALWLMLATYAYVRGSRAHEAKWWFVFAVSAAMAQYTHNLAGFYLLPLAATPLLRRDWRNLRSVVISGLGAILLYLPWLMHLYSQITKISNAYWVEQPGAEKLFTLLLIYVANLPLPNNTILFIGLFISLAVIAISIAQTFRFDNRNANAMWLVYLSFTPPLLLFLFSQWIPIYIERALLPSGVIFCIWLAWSLMETRLPIPIRNGLLVMLAIGATFGLYQHVTYRGFPYAPYREVDKTLRDRIAPGDRIVHASKATCLPMVYFDQTLPQGYIADPFGGNTDTLAMATQEVLDLIALPDIPTAVRGAKRVWFVVLQQHIDAYIHLGYKDHPYVRQLEQWYNLQAVEIQDDLRVYNFIQKPEMHIP